MRIIGIDPGYAICGYGIIDVIGSSLKPVTYGVITTEAKTPEASRLEIIFNELSDILEEFRPQKFGIEKLYFARNVTTGIGVAQARGVTLKQSVVGYGKATKEQVTYMTMNLLGIREKIKPDDAADALAIAICTAHSSHTDTLKQILQL